MPRQFRTTIVLMAAIAIATARVVAAQPPLQPMPLLQPPLQHLPPAFAAAQSAPGVSPYAAWPDGGMPAAVDRDERLAEIHPRQADLINAAYAGFDYRLCEHWCAGCPQCIRPHAIPSNTAAYAGYEVGGGAAFFGEGHYPWEGTWGWDYVGRKFRRRVSLGWSHQRYQGGTGAYEPDGPKILPRHE